MVDDTLTLPRTALFAKKGEAAPCGAALKSFAGQAAVRDSGSPMSFLITRRVTSTAASEAASMPTDVIAKKSAPPPPVVEASDEESPPRIMASDLAAVDALYHPMRRRSHTPQEDWRRISLRVRKDDYRRLKSIVDLWGVTQQSLLEKAVRNFLEQALTGEDLDWRH